MNYMDWCTNVLENKQNEKELQEKIKEIIEINLKDKGEYVIEKFIKSYCEPIIYYESLCLRKNKILPIQIKEIMNNMNHENYCRICTEIPNLYREVQNLVSIEINKIDDNISIEDISLKDKNNEDDLKDRLKSLLAIKSKKNSILSKQMIKKYYKTINYLEELLLIQNEIELDMYSEPVIYSSKVKDMSAGISKVNLTINSEIRRQFRHFLNFINEI